jgi:hypothetical protein
MEPTHFLNLIENPRKDFAATMTEADQELSAATPPTIASMRSRDW